MSGCLPHFRRRGPWSAAQQTIATMWALHRSLVFDTPAIHLVEEIVIGRREGVCTRC